MPTAARERLPVKFFVLDDQAYHYMQELPLKQKVWGLSIQPERLHQIRSERRPESRYAALDNCRYEVAAAEKLMRQAQIPYLDSTTKSIEEIATTILRELRIHRQVY